MLTVTGLIRKRAADRGYTTIQALHQALQVEIPTLTYPAVHHWWTGKHRPQGAQARALARLLELEGPDHVALYEAPLPDLELIPPTSDLP
jgi:hypothetical protein